MSKLKTLIKEYQYNIKSRKLFDLRTIHKINNLDVKLGRFDLKDKCYINNNHK
jgi:hypothetical protein